MFKANYVHTYVQYVDVKLFRDSIAYCNLPCLFAEASERLQEAIHTNINLQVERRTSYVRLDKLFA